MYLGRLWKWLLPRLAERNLALLLGALFLGTSAWVLSVPYDAMETDLADATTNEIWSGLIREGRYSIPLDEWKARGYPPTQSSVVELDGTYHVVNEKGPAHAMLVAALDSAGLGWATGTLCAGLAVLATYMLGRRLFGWKAGFLAALFVMSNLTVIVMWHRYLWTDTSTMHFLVLGVWLLSESQHLFRRGDDENRPNLHLGAAAVGLSGGLALGFSIATRYPVALVAAPLLLFVLAGQAGRARGFRKQPRRLLSWLARSARDGLPFLAGLLLVLAPLMQYNATYFGGPLRSGYDATSLYDFTRTGEVTARNQSEQWSADWQDGLANVARNGVELLPIMLVRMPVLLLVPFAAVLLRRKPEFWLFVPWAVIIFATYLSLPWVGMYSRALDVPWEPRYFMPALPALAILAAHGLDRLSFSGAPDGRRTLFAVTVAAGVVLSGMVPASGYLRDMAEGVHGGKPGGQPPAGYPVQPGPQFIRVGISQLALEPARYAGEFVRVENATVSQVRFPAFDITDGVNAVTVRLENFTTAPPFLQTGARVNVQGPWMGQDRNQNGRADPGEFLLTVKNGTTDRIEKAQ